jgi:tubulin polyglutamylase TTLL6/13
MVIKTMCVARPHLVDSYRQARGKTEASNMCFEVLGFDVMLDKAAKPWLLEINGSPSFSTDTPLDAEIKRQIISDAISLIGVPNLITGKWTDIAQQKVEGRDVQAFVEAAHTGAFTKIYPVEDRKYYDKFLDVA